MIWATMLIPPFAAMSVVEVKDLDKLAKMSKVDLKAIYAKKTEVPGYFTRIGFK
jgi:hypothetical protein